jgi:uncharacterized protein
MKRIRILALAASLFAPLPAVAAEPLKWSGWSGDLFARAASEKRFVILDLEAVWCHWCHVMEATTYADPKVGDLIGQKYIPVRVDQDGNPDLSSRYGDWGWPATIIFAPDGTEIAKIRGYIEPERMASLLQAVIDDPTPGPSIIEQATIVPSASLFVSKEQQADLGKNFDESYDDVHAGWGGVQRFIDADSMDYDMALAENGNTKAEGEARKTFDAALALIDPVWGGVYQYSDKVDWSSPHFEKIMSFQAQYLRQYSQAYAHWHDARYLKAASAIKAYLTGFLLSPEGAFYVSQDADLDHATDGHKYYALDDAQRRKLGLPRIDAHLYARENGWAISGLAAYYDVTGDPQALAIAERAARWALANRAIAGGGFRHGAEDRGGPFLGDTLAIGQAFIDLYAATGARDWLTLAATAGDFVGATFLDASGGFLASKTAEAKVGVFATAAKQFDDQVGVARFMNILHRYTGKSAFSEFAAHAMRYAVSAANEMERPLPGLLLANMQIGREPTHITIIGHKEDKEAQALAKVARAFPAAYKRLDWWDTREGPLGNPDVTYPELDQAAAFACGNHVCSLPAFTAAELTEAVEQMAKVERAHAKQ